MQKKLSTWAKEQNVPYHSAWRQYQQNKIPNAKLIGNSIMIEEPDPQPIIQEAKTANVSYVIPLESVIKEIRTVSASTRTNKSARIIPTDRFKNIEDGITPFTYQSIDGNSYITVREAVELVMKCYYNFSVFRGVIDLMSELAAAPIYFEQGNVNGRKFFKAYFDKINLCGLVEEFFREYFRSGNVFIFRHLGKINEDDLLKITQVYGNKKEIEAAFVRIPIKFSILNPTDMLVNGSTSFLSSRYFKQLSDYEIEVLKNPRTEEDQQIFDNLSPEIKKQVKQNVGSYILLPLDSKDVYYIGYKKQSYEPLAIPMGFSVLDDISRKEEMKKMDASIARIMQQVVLLITMGYETKAGEYAVNQKQINAIQTIFNNQSVGRVLVSDFTTKAEFIVPDIADILTPEKYEVLERDIAVGLNNILGSSSEKFANKAITVEIFVERLKQARDVFLNSFLKPEIKRIAREIGFKVFPTPVFEDIDLRDEVQMSRIYTQLAQLGILTPDETIRAMNTGQLPTPEDSEESQTKFKSLKDKGLYQPLIGGQTENGGRPGGISTPKPSNVGPIGKANFSLSKIVDNLKLFDNLEVAVEKELLKKHKLKTLNKDQQELAHDISTTIVANEISDLWIKSINKYLESPDSKNEDRINQIEGIAKEHQVNTFLAGILLASAINE